MPGRRKIGGCSMASTLRLRRGPTPITHADTGAPPAVITSAARATSQRKLRTASAPPARTPPATDAPATRPPSAASTAEAAHVSRVTRAVSSPGVIENALRTTHRSKEVHEPRRDAEHEPDQQEPGRRSQPAVQIVAPDQPDHRRDHQCQPDRGQLSKRFPGPLLPGWRHVNKDTSTMT